MPLEIDVVFHDKGWYKLRWQTPGSWAGSCRQVVVSLTDRSVHRLEVRFAEWWPGHHRRRH